LIPYLDVVSLSSKDIGGELPALSRHTSVVYPVTISEKTALRISSEIEKKVTNCAGCDRVAGLLCLVRRAGFTLAVAVIDANVERADIRLLSFDHGTPFP
jgi:hypothetical protein